MPLYQSIKYFLTRAGLSLFILLVPGFFILYLVHEVALPQMQIDDSAIQWTLLLISLFFGFFGYGLIGDQRFQNAFHELKDAGPGDDPETTLPKFESLLEHTFSSYFLPHQGRRRRNRVIQKYADYLLSIGREDAHAQKIYLKAFLLDPHQSKFRGRLISMLGRGSHLSPQEIDLVLILLKAENYQDEGITHQLAAGFLEERKLNPAIEPLYLKAVTSGCKEADAIVRFVLPQLLERRRSDELALRFYWAALPYDPPGAEEARALLARSWCEKYWEGIDPGFHEKLGQVYQALDPATQEQLRRDVQDHRLSGRFKKVRFISAEDREQIQRWKIRLGIQKSVWDRVRETAWRPLRSLQRAGRAAAFVLIDGLAVLGRAPLKVKLAGVSGLCVLVLAGLSFQKWYEHRAVSRVSGSSAGSVVPSSLPPGQISQVKKIHTIQVAAMTTRNQADRVVRSLKKNGVRGIYVVQSKRRTGGNWYKIRVGEFAGEEEARRYADRLIETRLIKNYFVLSLPKKKVHSNLKTGAEKGS